MRFRLSLLYSIVIGIVIAALSVFIYLTMARHTENILKASITAQAEHIITLMTDEVFPPHEPHSFSLPVLDRFENQNVFVQILDMSGAIIASSENSREYNFLSQTKSLESGFHGTGDFYRIRVKDGSYMVGLFPVSQPFGRSLGMVIMAMSERERLRTLSTLLYILIAGGAGSLALVWIVGWSTASAALKPIREAIDTARAVALSKSFSRKMTYRNTRDELDQMIRAFNEMLDTLETAQATQRRFIADASHELRAPLTVIRGNLDLLERAMDKPQEEQKEILKAARSEVDRMSRLVTDMLSLARADSGISLQMAEVEMDSVIIEVFKQLLSGSPGAKLSLSRVEPALVSGERDRLRQMAMILIDNALRYTPAGGAVTLSLVREEPWAVFSVADTGIGIDSKDLPSIFERFYRSERAREMDPGGTGLGLAIAKWIISSHGGDITLESQAGKGTVATVQLPLLR